MDISLTGDDVFEIAIRIEHNAARFYLTASRMGGFTPVASAFRRLAEMELAHEQTFTEMRARLGGQDDSMLPLPSDSDTARYLNALLADKFFAPDADPADHLLGADNPRDILLTAIGMEKETMAFYLGVEGILVVPADIDAVEDILSEEMSHIVDLSAQLSRLDA